MKDMKEGRISRISRKEQKRKGRRRQEEGGETWRKKENDIEEGRMEGGQEGIKE